MHLHLQQKPLFFFFFFLSAIIRLWWSVDGVVSDPQANYVQLGCDQEGVNDASIFHESLNATFRDLRGQIQNQSKHFATAKAVKGDSPAFGLFQCRNYLSIADCIACFDVAAIQIRKCSAAVYGARLVLDGCFLRYESSEFSDQASDNWNNISCGNEKVENSTMPASTVQQVLTDLVTVTPRIPSFFVATKTPLPNSNDSNIYAFAQCVETITQTGCQDCLNTALRNFQMCSHNSNAMTYDVGCFMRYSITAFFADNQTTDISHFLKQGSSNNGEAIIGGVVGGVALVFILLTLFAWTRQPKSPNRVPRGDITGATKLKGLVTYNYKDLKCATNNFNEENKLGEGGFGVVYKGILKDGKVVAVKKLTLRHSMTMEEDFESEVKLISNAHHRNLIQLLGCCRKGYKRILIYEYMKNNSLDTFIFGEKKHLTWKQRYDIILGTARGLAYLHEELYVRIIYRDIKPNNILLDDDLQPKIADFGLVRLLPEDRSHLSTRFVGTLYQRIYCTRVCYSWPIIGEG